MCEIFVRSKVFHKLANKKSESNTIEKTQLEIL